MQIDLSPDKADLGLREVFVKDLLVQKSRITKSILEGISSLNSTGCLKKLTVSLCHKHFLNFIFHLFEIFIEFSARIYEMYE